MYALSIDKENGRILYATYEQYASEEQPLVDVLPDGDLHDYRYVEGEFVHDPLPKPEQPEAEETQDYGERIAELEEALAMLLSGVTE